MHEAPTKYADVILDFGDPVLRLMGPTAPLDSRRETLSIVITAWNASVVDDALGTSRHVDELRRVIGSLTGPGAAEFASAIENLLVRKREQFAEDRWAVAEWDLVGTDADFQLRVEVHQAPAPAE